ncbi:MAG: protein-glutamate O-methyltransferase CheR [Actinobacteria bacterium]|nr:protein-glutamate O-methyltransferase CheR [Actinomycetota bacterium]
MGSTLDIGTFDRFRTLVYEQTGISLGPHKEALVQARVGKRLRALGLRSYDDYLDLLEADETGGEFTLFVDAICTNVTSFFREAHQFDFIAERVSEWLDEGQRRFRFWSCACSSGEEPYSLAMTLLDVANGYPDVDIRILATDISTRVLDRCLDGCYSEQRVTTVPAEWRSKWMTSAPVGKEAVYRVGSELRDLVLFRRMNLAAPPFPMTGPLDIVMCRNVMIYFDDPVRIALLDEIHRMLRPGGFLIVGHAESLTGINAGFKYLKPATYVRR